MRGGIALAGADQVSRPLPVALVGAGRVAHAVYLRLLPDLADDFELVAIVETDQERAAAARRISPGSLVTCDLDHVVRAGARAAICATPWPTHAEIVSGCLELGLPVLCEKPVSLDPDEIGRLREREKATGLSIAVGYMKRHDPVVAAFVEFSRQALAGARMITVRVVDPNASHQVTHLMPAGLDAAAGQAATADRLLARLLPQASEEVRTAYAHGLGGSLIHHVNLLNAILDGSGGLFGTLGYSAQWDQGRSVSCCWQPSPVLVVQASHVRVPGHRRYREVIELVCEDAWASLTLPSPYARDAGATMALERWPGEPGRSVRTVTEPAAGQTGFGCQLAAWARSMRDGRARQLPGLAEAELDLLVVREATHRLSGPGQGSQT